MTSSCPPSPSAERQLGVDEAGYGPLLGPLVVCAVAVAADDEAALAALAGCGVADSKAVHRPGDLAPLERVALPALAWLSGFQPDTAADVLALCGESADQRSAPWQQGAEQLRVPLAARALPSWRLPGLSPAGLRARILHPRALNEARAAGRNRAACLLAAVGAVLGELAPDPRRPTRIVIDRLGGRLDYGPWLSGIWPGAAVQLVDAARAARRYRVAASEVLIAVGADRRWPLPALASCIAKYARELHMHLFNRWWCARHRWLAPTAGYGADARRWLYQIGEGQAAAWRDELVRLGPRRGP
ncbi:MAG: hypothetical protein RMM29_01850 [Planctomycetota bacterium]|nr:hypothetical protein [Planctomycetota bacterium]MDW8372380.1 hypothetical protein [Planctomycetota bacterium]